VYANNQVRDRIIFRALGLDAVAADQAKRRLMDVGIVAKNWEIPAWDRRQFVSDVSTQRVRKYRNNKQTRNVSGTVRNGFGNAPDTDTDTDTENTPPPPKTGGVTAFSDFWSAYPKRVDRKKSETAWRNLSKRDQSAALADIKSGRFSGTEKQYIPNPTTYLHGKRWEDERSDGAALSQEQIAAIKASIAADIASGKRRAV
jgi:hypothetical protein